MTLVASPLCSIDSYVRQLLQHVACHPPMKVQVYQLFRSCSHSFQSCVFQSSNLSVICPRPFQGQKLIARSVRLVKVCMCVCTCVCEKVHRPCLIGLERASRRLSLPLNYLPDTTFSSLLQKCFRRHLVNVLSFYDLIFAPSLHI